MIITREFTNQLNMVEVIDGMTAQGCTLIEVQNHLDGNYLLFDDGVPEPEPRNLEDEIDGLKDRLTLLEIKDVRTRPSN